MKLKFIENSLIYRINREEELDRMQRRIEEIKTTRGPLDNAKLSQSLPKLATKVPMVEAKLRLRMENRQLVERIVHAVENTHSPLHLRMNDPNQSERRIPKNYFYRQEEQRRIDIENERLGKVISTTRRRKLL